MILSYTKIAQKYNCTMENTPIDSNQKNYKFTQNWFLHNAKYWNLLFQSLAWDSKQPKSILEIGSFEGQSTCWMLENLIDCKDSRIFCLDTFKGGEEHQTEEYNLESLFNRFMHNINVTGKKNCVNVLIGDSKYSLSHLISKKIYFDFIYVDGSHRAKDVLADAVLSWILLKKGGLMVFDDYLWNVFERDIKSAPKMAIDSFVNCYFDEIRILRTPQNYQLCILKK